MTRRLLSCLSVLMALIATSCGESPSTSSPRATPTPPATQIKLFAYVAATMRSSAAIDSNISSIRGLSTPVHGISWRFKWSLVEPADGEFDWSLVDQALSASEGAGKKVLLRVVPGSYSPAWLMSQVQTVSFPNTIFPNPAFYPPTVTMPVPWDSTYLAKWEQFVAAFGKRYDGKPVLFNVGMGGGGVIDEMYVPPGYAEWQRAGYSDSRMIGAWDSIIDSFQIAFPTTPTSLDIDEPLGVGHGHVLQPVVDYALQKYRGHIYIQQNGLRANYGQTLSSAEYEQVLDQAAPVTQIGLQMFGGKGPADAKTGDRLTAFQTARRLHVNYIEVYLSDLEDPGLDAPVRYLIGN